MITAETATLAARRAMTAYGFRAEDPLELVKYRENYVFRLVDAAGVAYAVRVHRLGYRTAAQIRTEIDYLVALSEHEVSTPSMIHTLDGRAYFEVAVEPGARVSETVVVDVQHWIPDSRPLGSTPDAVAGTAELESEDFSRLGSELARLHLAMRAIGRTPGFERDAWDAAGLVGPDPLWGDPTSLPGLDDADRTLIEEAGNRLDEVLDALPHDEAHYGVIHADLTAENVLVSPAGLVLIDFDDFGCGWHLFDLVTVLFHYTRHPRLGEYRDALFAGYTAVRPDLPEGFLDGWDALLLARGLTYLGWAAQRHGDPEAAFVEAEVAPIVLDLARDFLGRVAEPGSVADEAVR